MSPSKFGNLMGAIEGAEGDSSGADLLFQAEINDNTQAFFDKFDANVKKTDQTAQTGFKGVSDSANKSNVALAAVAGVVAGITSFLVGMAKAGVEEFASMLQEAYKVTEAYDKVASVMYIVGQNAGYSNTQLDKFVAGIKAEGMSSMGAVQSLTKMAQAHLDLTKSQDLARVAADASTIAGESEAQAMNSIVRSIQVLSPRLLQQMGIYVNMTKEEQKYAEAHNTTVKALDNSTKQQIMMNAVLEQGKNIQGAYAASLKTAAGQETLRAQTVDEINLALGRLVQPAYLQYLKTVNGVLEDVLNWLDKNKTGIEEFANEVGNSFALTVNAVETGADSISKATTVVLNTFANMAKGVAGSNKEAQDSIDQFFARLTDAAGLLHTFSEAWILAGATISGVAEEIAGVAISAAMSAKLLQELIQGKITLDEYNAKNAELTNIIKSGTLYWDGYNRVIKQSAPLLQDVTTANNDAAAAAAKEANALKLEGEAVDSLNTNLEELQKKLEEDKATAAIKAQRDVLEAEQRDSWARQDMAKGLADNIEQIEQNSKDNRVQLVKQYADARWQIEHNYQIAVKRLQDQFDVDTSEAARRRDAVSMLALVRKNERDLKNLKEGKTQQEDDAKKSFNKVIKDQDDALAKQLKAAHDSYTKQLAEYKQSKDREKIIQDMHNKWAQEDIQRATDKQLQTFIDQYNGMDGATKAGLQTILNDWGSYFTDLNKLIGAEAPGIANAMNNMLGSASNRINSYGNTQYTPSNPRPSERGGSVTGQAGLVSSMLTPSGMRAAALDTASSSRVPSVRPQSDRGGHRTLDVNVAGNALDPYIQRIVVRNLTEIERNAS